MFFTKKLIFPIFFLYIFSAAFPRQSLLEKGEVAFKNGNFITARKRFSAVISENELMGKDPVEKKTKTPALSKEEQALILLRYAQMEESFIQARYKYTALIKNYPSFSRLDQAYYDLGELYYLHPNYEEAAAAFELLLKTFPKSSFQKEALKRLGQIYLIQNNVKKVEKVASLILAGYPQDDFAAWGHYLKGHLSFDHLRYQEAMKFYSVIENKYKDTEITAFSTVRMGDCHYALGKISQARQAYGNVMRNYPNSEEARIAEYKLRGLPGSYYLTPPTGKKMTAHQIVNKGDLTKPKKKKPATHYYVQVGALRNRKSALNLKGRLNISRMESKILKSKTTRGVYHTVLVGPYMDRRDAEKARTILIRKYRFKGAFLKKITE